jgi:hypothetical protein
MIKFSLLKVLIRSEDFSYTATVKEHDRFAA